MNKKTSLFLLLSICLSIFNSISQSAYKYTTYPDDPLNSRIYVLENGLTVMMTVYKDAPRIQTYIAVKVGSKNDPKETTGLAHYLEHLMFKGTQNIGTVDWNKEQPMLQTIEDLFEIYRATGDSLERERIYAQIDSISYNASKLAIPSEYEGLMMAIGATGTNAATSYDYTMYVDDIPSNELENWARIQAERFSFPVFRLFHTELETVYEEYNMGMASDSKRIFNEIAHTFFPNHPYGHHPIIGFPEHLKNPSLKNIREFYDTYYVANNMAICISGDFDPDKAIAIVDTHFKTLKQAPVPAIAFEPESPIVSPIEKDIVGLDAEVTDVSFRFDFGNGSREALILEMVNTILYNGKSGLIDMNINQKQQAIDAWAASMILNDYSYLTMLTRPKTGQSLEELTTLLLNQIELLKKGDFPDWIFEAALNNRKLEDMEQCESNQGRAMALAEAFVSNITWQDVLNETEALKNLTKKDIVDFANKYFQNNYLVIYKRQGAPQVEKVEKPKITPVFLNRDVSSEFYDSVLESKVYPIEPVFVDFEKDMQRIKTKNGIEILYNENKENETFMLVYHFNSGRSSNPKLSLAAEYLQYLGTSKRSLEEFNQEFYKLACNYVITASEDQTYIGVMGLSENMDKAIALLEELLSDPQPNQKALDNYINDVLKVRQEMKANQSAIFSALVDYGIYGTNSPTLDVLSEAELKAITPEELIRIVKDLTKSEHRILYYGPENMSKIKKRMDKMHHTPKKLLPVIPPKHYEANEVIEPNVYLVDYDVNQSYITEAFRGVRFSPQLAPIRSLYNNYFGSGSSSIIYQEMREKRSLAYTAGAYYSSPSYPQGFYVNNAFIATQNDKIMDALSVFNELFENIPLSENAFTFTKESILSNIRTQRITKMDVIWTYLNNEKMGYTYDRRMNLYKEIPHLTLQDIDMFNKKYIKGKTKNYMILGREKDLNKNELSKFGNVKVLTLEQIFGY